MKSVVFKGEFRVGGMMCSDKCSPIIFDAITKIKLPEGFSSSAEIFVDAEPRPAASHQISVRIEDNREVVSAKDQDILSKIIEEKITGNGFSIVKDDGTELSPKRLRFRFNVLINFFLLVGITVLWVTFPPSLLLTIGLMSLTFLGTAWTARHYLLDFFRNLRLKKISHMATPITLGWFLSLGHALYHAITMPLMHHFSMFSMNYIMPLLLITLVNVMDEIKRLVVQRARKMVLNNLGSLMPKMASRYSCDFLDKPTLDKLQTLLTRGKGEMRALKEEEVKALSQNEISELKKLVMPLIQKNTREWREKGVLQLGMLIRVERGQCFPVDGLIMEGTTYVDGAIITGEPCQLKTPSTFVPAGAVNLGKPVAIIATADSYHSTVNQLLFSSNRAYHDHPPKHLVFTVLYISLIGAAMAASILIPMVMGVWSISLVLANLTGILFTVCPCTIALAQQLPSLLTRYSCQRYGIVMRNEQVVEHTERIHTFVFDKTGTLTTGNSLVDDSYQGITDELWQYVYVLERHQGAEHPLAQAIQRYYEARFNEPHFDVEKGSTDEQHRGIRGIVNGKKIHIGNQEFFQSEGISIPRSAQNIKPGSTLLYVAEAEVFSGTIQILHEIRPEMLALLKKLKQQKVKLIMLTGDLKNAAEGFNQQNQNLFESENIIANHTPRQKEAYLRSLFDETRQQGICFVGDGLNDTISARLVSEAGGLSCALTTDDKVAFFSDVSLNESPEYLLHHTAINRLSKKIVSQNQGLLAYGVLIFLAFLVSFSVLTIPFSPLIPLGVMSGVTLMTLWNAHRTQWGVEQILKPSPGLKCFLASDLSMSVFVLASTLFITSILLASIATGGFAFPAMVFGVGLFPTLASVVLLGALSVGMGFIILGLTHSLKKLPVPVVCELEKESLPPIAHFSPHFPKAEQSICLSYAGVLPSNPLVSTPPTPSP